MAAEQDKTPESRATPQQAQKVVDEVDRITSKVNVLPGLKFVKNHSAPHKTRWHEGMLFSRYPDGGANVDDPDSIIVAGIAWDNEDGSRSSYSAELTTDGMQLTKHTFPPAKERKAEESFRTGDYATLAFNALADLTVAKSEHAARVEERAFGLHFATSAEADELIARLQPVEPAPEQTF
jgi:hypothetical protein